MRHVLRRFELEREPGKGGAQFVRDIVGHPSHRFEQFLDAREHEVEGFAQPIEVVARAAHGNAL